MRKKVVQLPDEQLFSIKDFQEALDERGFFEISEGQHLNQKALDASGMESQRVKHAVNMVSNQTADLIGNIQLWFTSCQFCTLDGI